jgi:hypothetical protein
MPEPNEGKSKQSKDRMASDLQVLVPLAGLEPATCCLGDNCRYLFSTVQCGLARSGWAGSQLSVVWFGCSRAWWNDCETARWFGEDPGRDRWQRV